MAVQPRLIQTDGHAVLSGVQMVVKAGLEAGADTLIGAQLDSPPPFTTLLDEHSPLLDDKGVRTLTLPDARQAIAALHSAWLSGRRAVGLFDAMGVIDAAGVLLDTDMPRDADPGGVLLALGPSDDSAGEAAVALLRRSGWVVLEPALQDEVKDYTADGLRISGASGRPVALALPEDLYRGAATVPCAANLYPSSTGEGVVGERASENVDPQSAVLAAVRSAGIVTNVNPPGRDEALPLALIALGRSFGWARQAMAELGLVGRVPMLRLGMLTPVDAASVRRHVADCRRVLVLDPTGLKLADAVIAQAAPKQVGEPKADDDAAPRPAEVLSVVLDAKAGPAGVIAALRPWLENHPTLPRELVRAGLERVGMSTDELSDSQPAKAGEETTPPRGTTPPAGSSLVDLSVVLGRLRRDLADSQRMLEAHSAGPIDLSLFGELDDAARLLLVQWSDLSGGLECDGRLAGAAAAGAGSSDAQRSVVLMTSRRFFSLGSSAIADAVRAGRSAVFVIHTEDPTEVQGPRRRWRRRKKANALDMQAIIEGIGAGRRDPAPSVTTIDPSDRPRLARLLERLILSDGVHVVIARRRRGPRYYRKASEVHQKQSARRGYVAKQGCLVHCPEAGPLTTRRRIELGVLGVESIEPGEDPWTVSVSWSWHDETVMHALRDPAVGLAILERARPERSRVVAEDLDDLPAPTRPIHANADAWRATLTGITGSAFDLTLEILLEAGAAMGYLVRSTRSAEAPDEPTALRADILFTRREPADAPIVPAAPGRSSAPMLTAAPLPGQTDLLLGAELTESVRQLAGPGRPIAADQGAALIDTLLIPDIAALASGEIPDQAAQLASIQRWRPGSSNLTTLPIARLAEWFWGHQRYAAWVYLGLLVQRGLIPLTTTAIDAASVRLLGVTDPRSAEALKVGRRLAVDPAYAERALDHEAPTLDALLRQLADDLAEQAGSRRGASLAGSFQALAQPLLDDTAELDETLRRQLLTTAQRCVLWAGPKHGPAYCERFVNTIRHVIGIDTADRVYALTRSTVEGLSRAMLIPDEVYLAALLTGPARRRRDRRRLNISLEQGDKVSYVHVLRPEFDLFKRRVGFTVALGERVLGAIAGLYVLRRVRPGWYRTHRNFRDLYLRTLAELPMPKTDAAYRHARDTADCAAAIRGRGDTRRASVNTARRRLEKLIAGGET